MIIRGLFMLARGEKAGIREFGDDLDSFTSSLAPLVAFPLVWAGITALSGQWESALVAFLAQICAVLALPVIVHAYAARTNREELWLRTVVAMNWSLWVAIPAALLVGLLGGLLEGAGLPAGLVGHAAMAGLLLYMLWLQWFIFSAGLGTGTLEGFALLVTCGLAQALFAITPMALGYAMHSPLVG
jgi:hypothetical protein